MAIRVITDTCSALKLLRFGTLLFQKNLLSIGDLVIHPRVFNETKKWSPRQRERYKSELAALDSVRSEPGLRPTPQKIFDALQQTLRAYVEENSLSVGRADIEQLASALHLNLAIVTNDQPFTDVADAFEIDIYTAEQVLCIAVDEGKLDKQVAIDGFKYWQQNREKPPSKSDWNKIESSLGIKQQ